MTNRRTRTTGKTSWPTAVIAVLIGWGAYLWATRAGTVPSWLVFAAGAVCGSLVTMSLKAWGHHAARRLGIQVTRAGKGQR